MANTLQLIWHQFRKETREHFWYLLGFALIQTLYTILGATLVLEEVTNLTGSPILSDNEELLFIGMQLPAILIAPFVALSDSSNDCEAFWLTKPVSATAVVLGKLLWLAVWFIGMPLVSECIMVSALGGGAKLTYIASDFILIRAAFVFTAFGLATLSTNLLHLAIMLFSFPFVMTMLEAVTKTLSGRSMDASLSYGASIFQSSVWITALVAAALVIAWAQYQWRNARLIGIPAAIAAFVLVSCLAQWNLDLSDRPLAPPAAGQAGFEQIQLHLDPVHINPGTLTVNGSGQPSFHARALLTGVPATGAVGLSRFSFQIEVGDRKQSFDYVSNDRLRFFEDGSTKRRIFGTLIQQVQCKPFQPTAEIQASMRIPIPIPADSDLLQGGPISITGTATFDCFDYPEFGRLKQAPSDGTSSPINIELRSSLERNSTRVTMIQPVTGETVRDVSGEAVLSVIFVNRHISALGAPDNHELWIKSHYEIAPWYYLLRDSRSGAFWEDYHDQWSFHCGAAVRCALHVNESFVTLDANFPTDEAILFSARYRGTIQRSFKLSIVPLSSADQAPIP